MNKRKTKKNKTADKSPTEDALIVPTNFQVRTLADRLADVVREQIILGEIAPGIAIKQDVLAAKLNVSKIPIREALSRLEQDGIVHSIPNRGFVATSMTTAEAEEVFALRLQIEPDAAARGAKGATQSDRKDVKMILSNLARASQRGESTVGLLHRNFHLALVKPAGRDLTLNLTARLHVIAERYVRKHLEPPGRPGRAQDEHYEMLDAWCAGDGSTVRRLMRLHIKQTAQELRQELKTIERAVPALKRASRLRK
ncbi:MAG: GntR family transcriptional regulator [Pseudomonadota bacterium]